MIYDWQGEHYEWMLIECSDFIREQQGRRSVLRKRVRAGAAEMSDPTD